MISRSEDDDNNHDEDYLDDNGDRGNDTRCTPGFLLAILNISGMPM